jgi:hypothetical protein
VGNHNDGGEEEEKDPKTADRGEQRRGNVRFPLPAHLACWRNNYCLIVAHSDGKQKSAILGWLLVTAILPLTLIAASQHFQVGPREHFPNKELLLTLEDLSYTGIPIKRPETFSGPGTKIGTFQEK